MTARPGALNAVLMRATRTELTLVAIRVHNEARRLCPVDTGNLRRTIGYSIHGATPETMSARVGSNAHYALAVEKGTGIYGPKGQPITPKKSNVLVFPGKGGTVVYARSVRGRKATPFLRPALSAARRAG